MIQRDVPFPTPPGLHVAIIMDGNGRWATRRGRPRSAGHRAGARAARGVIEAAPRLGIGTLTLFAFSADNWQRPPQEVRALMRLLQVYLRAEISTCLEQNVRLRVIGRREGMSPALLSAMAEAESATAHGRLLDLRIAINYSARQSIVDAACRVAAGDNPTFARFSALLGEACQAGGPAPDVDLLVRTGGEQRLSDFLLWECAYAEMVFSSRLWPDFTAEDLGEAVRDYHHRERRFGAVPVLAAQ
ncbi:MAG TPA: polyprenyl diphosphate synthase [Chloroflexota bacterium]|nr:polyprenyl diphosphate synthase [Chloroflexota bacterium]